MQCTIAVSALEALYQQQSMKKKDMVDKIYNIFQGCEQTRTASFADMAFQGQSQFKVLYDFGDSECTYLDNGAHTQLCRRHYFETLAFLYVGLVHTVCTKVIGVGPQGHDCPVNPAFLIHWI
jgi:hypothetical protein